MTTVVQVAFSHTHRHRTLPPMGRSVYMDLKGVGRSIIQYRKKLSKRLPEYARLADNIRYNHDCGRSQAYN